MNITEILSQELSMKPQHVDNIIGLIDEDKTALKTVYIDGTVVNELTFQEVRENLYGKRD